LVVAHNGFGRYLYFTLIARESRTLPNRARAAGAGLWLPSAPTFVFHALIKNGSTANFKLRFGVESSSYEFLLRVSNLFFYKFGWILRTYYHI
jgi:hypothetical protein